MKFQYQKQFILTQSEQEAIKNYLSTLRLHPLPCHDCPALKNQKCQGYTIWTQDLIDDEKCLDIIDWFDKTKAEKQYFYNLEDAELKQIIENRYFLQVAKDTRDKNMAIYKLAESKYGNEQIERVVTGYSREKDEDLWTIEITDETEDI